MPKRRRKEDPDVVKTKPDHRKAAQVDDDADEITEDEDALDELPYQSRWTCLNRSRFKRAKVRKSLEAAAADDVTFPFMKLPSEIRNMIYRYLVCSTSKEPIALDQVKSWMSGGIQIDILMANRQIYGEACKILYDENKFSALWSRWDKGVSFRHDNEKTKYITSRALRNGRRVDMITHSGLIYKKVFQQLRHVELRVSLFDRLTYCDHITMYWFELLHNRLAMTLHGIIHDRDDKDFDNRTTRGVNWKLVVKSQGPQATNVMRAVLSPILDCYMLRSAVTDQKLEVRLEGKFPESYKSIFRRLEGVKGFDTRSVVITPAAKDVPRWLLYEFYEWDHYLHDDDTDWY